MTSPDRGQPLIHWKLCVYYILRNRKKQNSFPRFWVKDRGRKYGVIGTPSFFINGQKLQGTVTFEQMKALIQPQAS